MRLTNRLYAQHLGWMFKKHWQVQGKRVPRDTGALAELEKLGIEIKNPEDALKGKSKFEPFEGMLRETLTVADDDTNPNWHQQICHTYGNENVLLEGIPQAQVLVNTLEINGFPKPISEAVSKIQISSNIDKSIQNTILAASILDAEQVKLPKKKLEDRPTINLPREYGISSARKQRLLLSKLLAECERLAGHTIAARRKIVDNANFKVNIPRGNDLLQFSITSEKLLTANRPLEQIKGSYDGELPDLYPMKSTITMPKTNIYTTNTVFPFGALNAFSHPHTLFLNFDKEKVTNLHGSKVSSTQFQSRSLLKSFGVAAARALHAYGDNALKKLDKPIVVQSVQTDGRIFHFGVFQLNTLSLCDNGEVKNYWFHQPEMELFSECAYMEGKPTLTGYNKNVFRVLNAFYNSS